MLTAILISIIGALLVLCAFQSFWHERAMERAELRWSMHPQLMFIPTPKPELEEPIPLVWRRPRFDAYGVDVSFAPTIGVGELAVGRLPSFTMQGHCTLDSSPQAW